MASSAAVREGFARLQRGSLADGEWLEQLVRQPNAPAFLPSLVREDLAQASGT